MFEFRWSYLFQLIHCYVTNATILPRHLVLRWGIGESFSGSNIMPPKIAAAASHFP
jgi:hypothetical protein